MMIFSLSDLGEDDTQGETPRLLSPALFRARVIPVLLRLFEVHEEHVRVVLLSHLEAYAGHFTQEQLKTVVLPQVGRAPVIRGAAWKEGGWGHLGRAEKA